MVTELFFFPSSWSHSCYTLAVFLESYSRAPSLLLPRPLCAGASCQSTLPAPLSRLPRVPDRPRDGPGTHAKFARGAGPGGQATLSRPQGGTGLGRDPGSGSSLTIPSPAAAAGVNDGVFRKAEGALWRGRAASDGGSEAGDSKHHQTPKLCSQPPRMSVSERRSPPV